MLTKIHHINIVVRDLEAAVRYYERVLGVGEVIREALPRRGAITARFRAGESWIVLIEPTDASAAPGRHLASRGEGLFLLSFGVDDVRAAAAEASSRGADVVPTEPRAGLGGWQVIDLGDAPGGTCVTQLCEDAAG